MTARPVVVAVDGSAESLRAVEWAVREAELRSAPLRIVSAASLPKMVVLPLQPERDAVLGYVREQRDRALLAPGLPIDTDPVEGQAARAVTESGSDALMLVTGFRGTGAFAATVPGSVGRYAADHASCPVWWCATRLRPRTGWSASASLTWRTAPMCSHSRSRRRRCARPACWPSTPGTRRKPALPGPGTDSHRPACTPPRPTPPVS